MNIGIIGLGNMGLPLFKKLIRNNFNVNVLIEKNNTQKLIKCNVYKQNNLNDFIKNSSTIISVLPNSKITLEIVNNISSHSFNHQKKWLDICSSCPNDVKNIDKILNENNIKYIDAPVSGGPKGMNDGTLTSIVSGPKKTYKDILPIIELYSDKIYYISHEVGTSSMIKIANNTLLALHLISAAEILNILDKKNINIKEALQFINHSSGRSWATLQRYPEHILTNKYDYGFSYELHKKDILTFLNTTEISNKFLLDKLKDIYQDNNSFLRENMDHTEIVKIIK
ncbi:MAG: hypothetical protein CMF80_08140 [Candidatus Marinimicrobia bacterium]|nr:hypothetical protein [Candidatus Neomarinimicrobiota bacterium]